MTTTPTPTTCYLSIEDERKPSHRFGTRIEIVDPDDLRRIAAPPRITELCGGFLRNGTSGDILLRLADAEGEYIAHWHIHETVLKDARYPAEVLRAACESLLFCAYSRGHFARLYAQSKDHLVWEDSEKVFRLYAVDDETGYTGFVWKTRTYGDGWVPADAVDFPPLLQALAVYLDSQRNEDAYHV
ncbi:MAG: hypothetical protein LC754_10465 [Acidobacteria bacterium]|nr:hypothetical protein [Acidobacteriota bacterium]